MSKHWFEKTSGWGENPLKSRPVPSAWRGCLNNPMRTVCLVLQNFGKARKTTKEITIPEWYAVCKDVFSKSRTSPLLLYRPYDCGINLLSVTTPGKIIYCTWDPQHMKEERLYICIFQITVKYGYSKPVVSSALEKKAYTILWWSSPSSFLKGLQTSLYWERFFFKERKIQYDLQSLWITGNAVWSMPPLNSRLLLTAYSWWPT